MISFLTHLDQYIQNITMEYGLWTYLILFLVIFFETGIVITPFLPGDSLLFISGIISASGALNHWLLMPVLSSAAIMGDSLNYRIGFMLGERAFSQNNRFIKRKYLLSAQEFYTRYGGKTIVIARFVPIIRTFAPFVAGIARMEYKRFLFFNILGGILWVAGFIQAGKLFGHMPVIKNNLSLVIFSIIIVSLLPAFYDYMRITMNKKSKIL